MRHVVAPLRFVALVVAGLACLLLVVAWHIAPAEWFLTRGDR